MFQKKGMVTGNIVPTISYFTEKGHIQEFVCRLQALHALVHGGDALFVLGSTGEGTYLKSLGSKMLNQRAKLILISLDAICEYSKKQQREYPLVIGAYGEKPSEVIEDMVSLTDAIDDYFKTIGETYSFLYPASKNLPSKSISDNLISGFVVPPPKNTKLDENALIEFYQHILKYSEYPIYMYNNPDTFAGNVITPNIIKVCKSFPKLRGIKDSSESMEQKLVYLDFLSENFSVSCGKEGVIGTFLKNIPLNKRKYAGFVPSLSNLTNNPAKIFKLGLQGNDEDMIKEQNEMNRFRDKLYDSTVSKGKAQRGIKLCFKYLYKSLFPDISTFVRPEFQRDVPNNIIDTMNSVIEECIKKAYITKLERWINV